MRINLGTAIRECVGIACGEGMAMGARALGLGPVGEDMARTAGYKGGTYVADKVSERFASGHDKHEGQAQQPGRESEEVNQNKSIQQEPQQDHQELQGVEPERDGSKQVDHSIGQDNQRVDSAEQSEDQELTAGEQPVQESGATEGSQRVAQGEDQAQKSERAEGHGESEGVQSEQGTGEGEDQSEDDDYSYGY